MFKKNKQQFKNILLTLITVLFLFFSYQYMVKADSDSQLSSVVNDSNISQVGAETLETLLNLRSMSLNADIFEDISFKKLVDFSVKLQEQPVGRINPFAPIDINETFISDKDNIDEDNISAPESGEDVPELTK
ncbi:MAG: hypothetical protein ABIG87_00920 [Patescibacteria group bacterium]